MLFNSYEFLFIFLPISVIFYYFIHRHSSREAAILWLVSASLFFYGWWNPLYLILITGSILFNYHLGKQLAVAQKGVVGKSQLAFGICVNLTLLAYFKYANFFADNLSAATGFDFTLEMIILPLAISFFTFQQISYLVDVYQQKTHEYRFLHYCLFVTFFPQLIAGPIVHHKEMLPQFIQKAQNPVILNNIAIGLSIFTLGLWKKVVLADGIAPYSNTVFNAADSGTSIVFIEAWLGALAYTLQLYFDFSGYSDMAIGAARLFGIILPNNFNSPYKSLNITDFWRRWHMTLSRFLRDYLYIPLGGNRKGTARRNINLLITMLLGGLWHGAGWNFVIWGGLHGVYLIINHAWRALFTKHLEKLGIVYTAFSFSLTLFAVVIAWVFFRAQTIEGALEMLSAMLGFNGITLTNSTANILNKLLGLNISGAGSEIINIGPSIIWISALLFISTVLPNTQQIMHKFNPTLEKPKPSWLTWSPSKPWGIAIGLLASISVLSLTQFSEFLYFQF